MRNNLSTGDLIYLGNPDDAIRFDGAFRVLNPKLCNTGETGIFLLSENLIGKNQTSGYPFKNVPDPINNSYVDSAARKWCETFYEEHFTSVEKAAILPTNKSDDIYVKTHTWKLIGGKTRDGKCLFVAAPDILCHDRLFFLSAEEADCAAYGFTNNESRLAYFGRRPAAWWLRSPHAPDFPKDVGVVFHNGWPLDFVEDKDSVFGKAPLCMRPALNLDASMIRDIIPVGEQNATNTKCYKEWVVWFESESEEDVQNKLKKYTYGRRICSEMSAKSDELGPFARLMMTVFLAFIDRKRNRAEQEEW